MKSDRFIPTSNHKNRYQFRLDDQPTQQSDPKVAKLYRMMVIDQPHKIDENRKEFFSQKSIDIEDQSSKSYEFLAKLGMDFDKFSFGPIINNKPDRILEALSLSDNFYLNLLDCSAESVLAVGLSRGVYLWKPSGTISRIREAPDVSCIKWNPSRPELIACGTKGGCLQIWDTEQNACLLNFKCHESRLGSISWFNEPSCLLSGGKDSQIISYDLRINRKTGKYKFHEQQICSLKTQPSEVSSGKQNFASGSNDKNLIVWNMRMRIPQLIYKHSAAVKGIAWHPTKTGILTSGGGTDDRCIKIWNTSSNQLVKSVDTGSQVCNLMYIKQGQSLISTHGFNKFETNIWQSSTMTKKQTLLGHTKRVLYLAAEPNGQTIITGAGDQTIRFWKLKQNKRQTTAEIESSIMTIR